MIRYKDNSTLALKTVRTVTGEIEYRKNCRKIGEQFYIEGEQCFLVEDKWYAYNSKFITFDHEQECYVLVKKDVPLVHGVVSFKSNGEPVLGNFTGNKFKNVLVNLSSLGTIRCISEQVLKDGDYIENISDGIWYYRKGMTSKQIAQMSVITSRKVFRDQGYNIEDNKNEFDEKVALFAKHTPRIGARAMRYGRFLGNTTFGCEFETSKGYIPEHLQYQLGLIICRDGSIDNAEFVTVPMQGAKGLVNLKAISAELKKRTEADIKCSFHIHLGTLPDDRLFIVSLYALAVRIQNEVFTMFPGYKTHWEKFKKKDYCQKLRKLGVKPLGLNPTRADYEETVNDTYYKLHQFLNDGNEPDDEFNRRNHQHIRTHKWERSGRYYYINFMNMFFSDRKTIEFRIHHATSNDTKIIAWLYICNAIVKYAEKNAKRILTTSNPITLNEVVDYYADHFKSSDAKFLSEYLKEYITNRKEYFKNQTAKGNYACAEEAAEDKEFEFVYDGRTSLF